MNNKKKGGSMEDENAKAWANEKVFVRIRGARREPLQRIAAHIGKDCTPLEAIDWALQHVPQLLDDATPPRSDLENQVSELKDLVLALSRQLVVLTERLPAPEASPVATPAPARVLPLQAWLDEHLSVYEGKAVVLVARCMDAEAAAGPVFSPIEVRVETVRVPLSPTLPHLHLPVLSESLTQTLRSATMDVLLQLSDRRDRCRLFWRGTVGARPEKFGEVLLMPSTKH
jgi:hypothetical protein